MNTYYEVIKYVKNLFESDDRVNNVVTGDFDQWKRDMFTLVHIDVTDAPYISENNTALVRFNIDINVLDIRDKNKEDNKDRFWFNDNRHDIWNDTLSILNLARNKAKKDYLDNDISLNDATSSATRITYAYLNGLDGWSQTWVVDVPDNFTAIC